MQHMLDFYVLEKDLKYIFDLIIFDFLIVTKNIQLKIFYMSFSWENILTFCPYSLCKKKPDCMVVIK